ncbi:MAG TPA: hypothetical protein PK890_03950 [Terrimesophilobacter sp.]|nr:hypothetical protein [Terrimesophilobacter sp.]
MTQLPRHPATSRRGILQACRTRTAPWRWSEIGSRVRCSLRGGIRFAPHIYSDSSDFDAVIDVLAAAH